MANETHDLPDYHPDEGFEDSLPRGWSPAVGEASRPLHEGGYYQHRYHRTLPGTNQYRERFLELVVDTVGLAPRQHCVELNVCVDDGEEVVRLERLATPSFDVDDTADPMAQASAEEYAHHRAYELMVEHTDYTYGSDGDGR